MGENSEKIVVVKYGGSAMINSSLKAGVIEDLTAVNSRGIKAVLVHGGGPEIDAMLRKTGKEARFVDGLRYTDEETMETVQMVLCGKVNKDIAALIQNSGGRALGLCGIDGGMLKARQLKTPALGLVGEIEFVDSSFIKKIIDAGIIPVISSVALNSEPGKSLSLNVNADTAAAKIAAALEAETLVIITDVPGILRNGHDPSTLIPRASLAGLEELKKSGVISKGMIPKTACCADAILGGVKQARIIDGRVPHALLAALSGEQIGTLIEKGEWHE